jgi:hypothetical protein
MSKKSFFIGVICILVFLVMLFPTVTYADQYYDQYPGNAFIPRYQTTVYYRSMTSSYIYHDDTTDEGYMCPVTFNVPDGSTYFIKSIGIRYKDNLTDGYLHILLKRINLYTGNEHTVASWNSDPVAANPSVLTASQGTETGYKLVDTKKFVYWLYVQFFRTGEVNPSQGLMLYQVRVHYGT